MESNMYSRQIELFEHVAGAFAQPESGRLSTGELYRIVAGRAGVDKALLEAKSPVGKTGEQRSLIKRRIRWQCQTLLKIGVIRRVDGSRGVWELTEAGRQKLRRVRDDVAVLAFSTKLGIAILGSAKRVFSRWNEPIHLALTSPPFPLRNPRKYGNPPVSEYIDFLCEVVEPIVENMVPGANLVLSLSNDIFEPGLPARSTYLEELTLALRQRLGLYLMDRICWESNKPPGPTAWASKERMQLNSGYDPLHWFCNDPLRCIADNRRVLEPHTEAHKKLIASGGVKQGRVNGDGAYRLKPGAYSNPTEGRIPRNVFKVSNHCPDQRAYKKKARELGLMAHGAPMALECYVSR
jgi:hypothetical protein